MQPEATPRPKRSLLAKSLALVTLLGAAYLLTTGTPNVVTGAFAAASFLRPTHVGSRVADLQMKREDAPNGYKWWDKNAPEPRSSGGGQTYKKSYYEKKSSALATTTEANLAKAEELRLAYKARNPDAKEMPGYMPFGEKMTGGRQDPNMEYGEGYTQGGNRWQRPFKDWYK